MGPLLCLLSAAGFGAMAIFGKLAYDAGVEVGDLLLVRFALAAALLLAVAAATGALRGLPRRSVLAGLAMGAIGYATQSGLYFNALERMDASLLALILYVYPALVLVGAVALGRERASVRRVAALLIALAGTALVLAGAASGEPRRARHGDGFRRRARLHRVHPHRRPVGAGVPPVALAALVCLGATCTFALASVVRGGPELGFGADGWAWVGAIAVVSTVGGDPLLLRRPGSGRAVGGVDPFDPRAGGHRRAGGRGVRGVARRGAAGRRRAGRRGRARDAVAGAPACGVGRRHAGRGQRRLPPLRQERPAAASSGQLSRSRLGRRPQRRRVLAAACASGSGWPTHW